MSESQCLFFTPTLNAHGALCWCISWILQRIKQVWDTKLSYIGCKDRSTWSFDNFKWLVLAFHKVMLPLLHPKWLVTIGGHVQSLIQATFIENQDVQTFETSTNLQVFQLKSISVHRSTPHRPSIKQQNHHRCWQWHGSPNKLYSYWKLICKSLESCLTVPREKLPNKEPPTSPILPPATLPMHKPRPLPKVAHTGTERPKVRIAGGKPTAAPTNPPTAEPLASS